MKKRKLFLSIIMCFVLGISTLAGCFEEPPTPEGFLKDYQDKINLNAGSDHEGELVVWAQSTDTETEAINSFVDSFKLKYPNIEVKVETFVNNAYISHVKNSNSSAITNQDFSKMPDVFWVTNETIPSLVTVDALAPINLIDGIDNKFSTDALVDSMVNDSMFNGNMYMMPRDYNQFVLYYNKLFFDNYSHMVDMPDVTKAMDNETFVDIMTDFSNLMKKQPFGVDTGATMTEGYTLDANFQWPSMAYAMFTMFGGEVVNKSGELVFNSEENLNALKWIKEGVVNGLFRSPDAGSNLGTDFMLFKSPFLIDTRAGMTAYLENQSGGVAMNDILGVMPLPELDSEANYHVGSGCSGYAMYRRPNNPTEAWLFLKHVVSEEGQNAYGSTGNSCPVLESLLTDENASWRNLDDYGIEVMDGFNHDAFIYKYDTCSVTMADFKSVIPAEAVSQISDYMTQTIKLAVSNTPKQDYEKLMSGSLASQSGYMGTILARYK